MSPRAVPKNRRLLPGRGHPKHSKDGFARKRRPPFDETSDAVRIAAGPGELPPVESGPDREGPAPWVDVDDQPDGLLSLGDGHDIVLVAVSRRLGWCRRPDPIDVRVECEGPRCR